MDADRNAGLVRDELFVGVTRPAMRWGVTYVAFIGNVLLTMEAFLLSKNLLSLLIAVPIHGLCAALCLRDPRYFELLVLWLRTTGSQRVRNESSWRAATYSPLSMDLPGTRGQRCRDLAGARPC